MSFFESEFWAEACTCAIGFAVTFLVFICCTCTMDFDCFGTILEVHLGHWWGLRPRVGILFQFF